MIFRAKLAPIRTASRWQFVTFTDTWKSTPICEFYQLVTHNPLIFSCQISTNQNNLSLTICHIFWQMETNTDLRILSAGEWHMMLIFLPIKQLSNRNPIHTQLYCPFCLFGLMLYVPVIFFSHAGMPSWWVGLCLYNTIATCTANVDACCTGDVL